MIGLAGHQFRRIKLRHPNGRTWPIITNEFSLQPGVLAFLYVKRWDIEKRYDEFKNGFLETRAWEKQIQQKNNRLCL
jgi:IS4 transposase